MKNLRVDQCTAGQICDLFGVSDHVLREWLESGCPIARRGERGQAHTFDAARVFEWWKGMKAEEARQAPNSASVELSRLRKSQRELIDTRTANAREQLIPATEAAAAWSWIRETFTARMGRVMDDAAGRGWSADVLSELELYIAEALAELPDDPLQAVEG